MRTKPIKNDIPYHSSTHSRGFTLVELLVVITIIVALAALAVFITRNVRDRAYQANAMSSLRQVGIAHMAYASENQGAINMLRDTNETQQEGGPGGWVSNSFWGRMQPYLFAGIDSTNQQVVGKEIKRGLNALFSSSNVDKMADTPFRGINKYGDGSGLPIPFAFNARIRPKWNQPETRISSLGDPSRILYCTYGRYFFNKTHGSEYTPMPIPGTHRQGIYYLPNRTAIACFVDGHVEMISPPFPDRYYE